MICILINLARFGMNVISSIKNDSKHCGTDSLEPCCILGEIDIFAFLKVEKKNLSVKGQSTVLTIFPSMLYVDAKPTVRIVSCKLNLQLVVCDTKILNDESCVRSLA